MNVLRQLILIVIASVFAAACTTAPIASSRRGLLDRLSELDQPSGRDYETEELSNTENQTLRDKTRGWVAPLKEMAMTSPYGGRGRSFHEGIGLKAAVGTPVYSVDEGKVIYSSNKMSGYGNMIVIEHPSGLYSVYAHHRKNLVRKNQKVKRGALIAHSGKSGRVSGPHLHFEVRSSERSYDPAALYNLGSRRIAASQSRMDR